MGMMMFGTSLEEWSSFISAFQTLIMMLTVEYGMEGLIDVDPISGTLFYALFLMLGYPNPNPDPNPNLTCNLKLTHPCRNLNPMRTQIQTAG